MSVLPVVAPDAASERANKAVERFQSKMGEEVPSFLTAMLGSESMIHDTYMNLDTLLNKGKLALDAKALMGFAAATTARSQEVARWFADLARKQGRTDADLHEVLAVVATCTSYNQLYKFRYLSQDASFEQMRPGLRATPFINSTLGKDIVELLCVGVSTINGCQSCVSGHVQAAIQAGMSREMVEEAVRITAAVAGISAWSANTVG
ncbi:MAG: carboxymuconolactone decarboxylase family protein [Myxococcales bacterium]|nr:carboxymuconolactone decarboxylase family protein [Myxococcales bacterium]MCB9642970.1 carboxymuconolactone decarboxylase family protein [Myxococcales bacterium]